MSNPWDNDPIVSAADAPPALRQIVAPQNKQPTPNLPTGYFLGPDGQAHKYEGVPDTTGQSNNYAFTNRDTLRTEFNALPEVKNYGVAVGEMGKALKAPDTPRGDLAIIYAFAKAMDPGSVVREGEMSMATATASLPEEYRAAAAKLTEGKRLPPAVRQGLIETIRSTVGSFNQSYDQRRSQYSDLAGRNGFDAQEVVGPHLGEPIKPAEEAYIKAHGGTPRVPGQQQDYRAPGDIGFSGAEPAKQLTPEQQAKDRAFLATKPTADQYAGFLAGLTGKQVDAAATAERLKAIQAGGGYSAEVVDKPQDISDVRGKGGFGEGLDATIRGVADVVPFMDQIAAGGDMLTRGGSFSDNLARERTINDYDEQNHFWLRTPGQVAGAAMLPMFAARTPAQLAKVAAAYGGTYAAGKSKSVADVPQNAIVGAATGAVTAWGGSKLLQKLSGRSRAAQDIPPLVDEATGRLNEPLEAAGPAGRVAAARDYGINLPAGSAGDRTAAIIERKLDVRPASAGVMNDSRRVVESQVQDAAENVAGKFGSSRTLRDAGVAAMNGAKSWISRFEETARKAYDAIPISPQAQSTLTNTRQALGELTTIFESNPKLAEQFKNTRLNKMMDALDPEQGGSLSWNDIKGLRSRVGEEIGEQRFSDSPMKSELRRLYAGLSEDMRQTAAAQGPQALSKFDRANNLYRDGQGRIDNALVSILGDDSMRNPEAAAAAIQKIAQSGKGSGNLDQLAQIRASTIKSGDWNEVSSALIRLGGQPAKSEGRPFDPAVFVRWYSDMTEPARNLLFGGANKELRQALDGFVAVNQRLANSNALRNTSNTAMASPTGTFSFPSAVALLFTGHPMAAGGLMAGTGLKAAGEYGMSRLWTSPKFVRWASGYSKMVSGAAKAGNALDPAKVRNQARLLERVAATDPAISQEALGLRSMLLGANDNASKLAASPGADTNQQDQQ